MNFAVDLKNTPFLKTSRVKKDGNRLNYRCEMLLSRNSHAICNKRVLDLASHDGLFTYACLKLGAQYVVGVEPRSNLVNDANENLKSLGCTETQYDFVIGDAFEYLSTVEEEQFDTILCFGFFYHIKNQTELLELIKGTKPKYLILDTFVEDFQIPEAELHSIRRRETKNVAGYMVFYHEDQDFDMASFGLSNLVGTPNKSLVEALLLDYGFNFRQINWNDENVIDRGDISDYKKQTRVSYIAEPVDS